METDFPRPILSVDIVPLALHEGRLCVLRAVREADPFARRPALIGGYVHTDEDTHLGATARRVLAAKAGLADLYIEQLSTFSGAARDPRGWSASVVYFSLSTATRLLAAQADRALLLTPVEEAMGMPFDHDLILSAAIERLRGKGAYSDLPARFLADAFTLSELHEVYEIVLGESLNIDAFRRKVMERGFIEETGDRKRMPGANRPSALYRLAERYSVFDRRI